MSLIEINWTPSSRQLRQFGVLCLAALPGAGWLWGAGLQTLLILLAIAALLVILAWVRPSIVRPLFVGMMLVAAPIGMLVGELAMMLIFFCVFLPISLTFRLMRRDALTLGMDRSRPTYWQPKPQPRNASSYYRRY